jgi:hypothetical protein
MPNGVRTPSKIAIAGTGHVGVTLAYACLIRGTGKTRRASTSPRRASRCAVRLSRHCST